MGLAEKRKIKEIQDTVLPGRAKDFEEICGKALPLDIDWAGFDGDLEGLNFLDNVTIHRLNMALRTICTDDMGKEAVREAVKTVKISNVKDKAAKKMSFENGVLHFQCAYAKGLDGAFSDGEIHKLLMSKL